MKDITPVVFSTDDNYVMPTAVAIRSLVDNYAGDNLYVVILVKNDLSDHSKAVLSQAIKSDITVKLDYISVGNAFGDMTSHISHISMATYYRLLLPSLLNEYSRCIYLDGDICVVDDISQFADIEMRDEDYVAGVKAVNILMKKHGMKKRLRILNISSINHYVNAGVLLMNLDAIRANGIDKKWLELAGNNYPVQDQDVINVACYDHIINVPPKYNAMPPVYRFRSKKMKHIYTRKQIVEARENPCIIHYADRYKPWQYWDIPCADVWRKYYMELFDKEFSGAKKIGFTRTSDYIKDKFKSVSSLITKVIHR